ncbi:hypothetical protein IMZ31_23120 (plasmid) [Pontibacillus sp. ALD_SL1]|uniref:hypothetical protein n=1 Tax=Pontibacillus sp. ALD_SL1 TaxID=2777185 RepID=UPI001A964A68|nr:hypothetical protein [Pontibacillus sp. ALD_SL1]QST02345.1 hypothetical protein IMZ31_23120 [Pontibacillus sp. ALD_SL1]
MNYDTDFLGFKGKVSFEFTYDAFKSVASDICTYFKKNSSSGQKLVIGYDTRMMAKEYAQEFSRIASGLGLKVFLGNRCAPSSVMVKNALHKKSMGTVVITGDMHDAAILGIRLFDDKGSPVRPSQFTSQPSNKKKLPKFKDCLKTGAVEMFDPCIIYEYLVSQMLSSFSPTNSENMVFSPLHGSGMWYFDHILRNFPVAGYTTHSEILADLGGLELDPSFHTEQLYQDMLATNSSIGIVLSPDCSTLNCLYGKHRLTTKESLQCMSKTLSHIKGSSTRVVVDKEFPLGDMPTESEMSIEWLENGKFHDELKFLDFDIAIDHLGRFYFHSQGCPDALTASYLLTYFALVLSESNGAISEELKRIKKL